MRLVRTAVRVRLPPCTRTPRLAEEIGKLSRRHAVRIVRADVPCPDQRGMLRLPRREHQIHRERLQHMLIGAR